MIVAAARELAGQHVCFVGVGLPNIAVNLAKRTVAPDLELVYEAGVFGARAGPPAAVHRRPDDRHRRDRRRRACWSLFGYYLQGGLHRRRASWARPRSTGSATSTRRSSATTSTRRRACPGSGGACEIAINAREVFVIMRQTKRSFVEKLDFRTSPGNLGGAENAARIRREQGWLGRGPVGRRHGPRHLPLRRRRRDAPRLAPPGRDARRGPRDDRLGRSAFAADLRATPEPTAEELRLIRDELDPEGAYTK